jgi:predicted protein tyrosine phosphatase
MNSEKEKKWKNIYLRSNKIHRAQQLGMDQPHKTAKNRPDVESINILFVCSKNQWRSLTGEKTYRDHPLVNTRSASTASSARHQISLADIKWADLIAVMERKHLQRLRADYPEALQYKDVAVLDIEDNYRAMDPELVELIKAGIDPLLADL